MKSLDETAQILRIIATIDNRNVTEETIVVWHELLRDATFEEVRDAAMTHLRSSTEYITPAVLLGRVRQTRFERHGNTPAPAGHRWAIDAMVPAPDGKRWAIDAIESGEYDDDHQH